MLIATSWPNPGAPAVQGGDKVAHLVLYAGLAWFTARAAAPGRRLPVLWTVAAVAAFGAADEWHQQFIPGRSTSAADWTADAAGGVLGALAASVAARRAAARRA